MITNLRKSGETDDEYLDRMIAIEKDDVEKYERFIKEIEDSKTTMLKRLEREIESIGEPNSKRKRNKKRQLVKLALQISTGVYVD